MPSTTATQAVPAPPPGGEAHVLDLLEAIRRERLAILERLGAFESAHIVKAACTAPEIAERVGRSHYQVLE